MKVLYSSVNFNRMDRIIKLTLLILMFMHPLNACRLWAICTRLDITFPSLSGVAGYAMDPNTPSPGNEFGLVATQLLDSPKATTPIDLDKDGVIDIFPGEPLKTVSYTHLTLPTIYSV